MGLLRQAKGKDGTQYMLCHHEGGRWSNHSLWLRSWILHLLLKEDMEGQDGEETEVSRHRSAMAVLWRAVKVKQRGSLWGQRRLQAPMPQTSHYYFVCKCGGLLRRPIEATEVNEESVQMSHEEAHNHHYKTHRLTFSRKTWLASAMTPVARQAVGKSWSAFTWTAVIRLLCLFRIWSLLWLWCWHKLLHFHAWQRRFINVL